MTKSDEALLARGNPGVMQRILIAEGDNKHAGRVMFPTTHEAEPDPVATVGLALVERLEQVQQAARAMQKALEYTRAGLWGTGYVGEHGSMVANIDAALAQAKKAGVK